MSKPTLFVGLDALLVPGEDVDPVLRAEIAPYAKAFMFWATTRFKVTLLTEKNPRDAFHLLQTLGLPLDAASVAPFSESKVDIVAAHGLFYWVDTILIPGEVSWLAQHGHTDKYMSVDPEVGVTLEHKHWLEGRTARSR